MAGVEWHGGDGVKLGWVQMNEVMRVVGLVRIAIHVRRVGIRAGDCRAKPRVRLGEGGGHGQWQKSAPSSVPPSPSSPRSLAVPSPVMRKVGLGFGVKASCIQDHD